MRDLVCLSLFVLALAVLEAAVGPHAVWVRTVLGFLVLAAAVVPLAGGARRSVLLLPAAAALALAAATAPPAREFLIAAALACLALAAQDERAATASTLALAGFGFAVFVAIRDHLSLWPALLSASAHASAAAGALVGTRTQLGPTYSGTWVIVAVGLVFLARAAVVRRLQVGPAVLAVVLLGLAPAAWLGLERLPQAQGFLPLGWRIVLFLLCIPSLALFLATHPASLGPRPVRVRRGAPAALVVVVGVVLLSWSSRIPARHVSVVVDTRGSFSTQPLQWGKYAREATPGASLATLPAILAAHGFACTLHDTTLDAATLAAHDVLLVMNPTREYTEEEQAAIWDRVKRGGGLLVLGDHTNIQESMRPLNTLLAPCGVQVQFDSAIPLVQRWTWYGCMRVHPHPVTRGLQDETDIKVSVGASLHLPPGALPLLTGRDAFSDAGNWLNRAGAYLGDMRFGRGELLGDLPLAAACTYGRGRVIVFGDTSTFQRSAVAFTYPFVLRILTYLAGPNAGVAPFAVRIAGALLAVTGAVLLAQSSALGAIAVATAVCGAWLAGLARVATVQPPQGPRRGEIAWIDLAHGSRVDVHSGQDDGIGGFVDHLWRQGYVPLAMRKLDLAALPEARIVATVAPAFPYSRAERRALHHFVESGGLLVVSTGYEERSGARKLLADFGYSIGRTPIGAAHASVTHLAGQHAIMHESWPVERPEGHGEVWVECWGYPLVVFERIGSGGLLVIGDSRFLCDSMQEGSDSFVEPNIEFLRHALTAAAGREPGAVP